MENMQLTKHFSLRELTTTDIKELQDKNYEEGRLKLYELCKIATLLESVRSILNSPMAITSGYRCKEVNDRIKGSKTSQHCKAEAADFIPLNLSAKEAFDLIIKSDLKYGQLILEKRGLGFIVHISIGEKRDNMYSPAQGVYEKYMQ